MILITGNNHKNLADKISYGFYLHEELQQEFEGTNHFMRKKIKDHTEKTRNH